MRHRIVTLLVVAAVFAAYAAQALAGGGTGWGP
jgi:hypothetical protein